jgi:hypothetical protein
MWLVGIFGKGYLQLSSPEIARSRKASGMTQVDTAVDECGHVVSHVAGRISVGVLFVSSWHNGLPFDRFFSSLRFIWYTVGWGGILLGTMKDHLLRRSQAK